MSLAFWRLTQTANHPIRSGMVVNRPSANRQPFGRAGFFVCAASRLVILANRTKNDVPGT